MSIGFSSSCGIYFHVSVSYTACLEKQFVNSRNDGLKNMEQEGNILYDSIKLLFRFTWDSLNPQYNDNTIDIRV